MKVKMYKLCLLLFFVSMTSANAMTSVNEFLTDGSSQQTRDHYRGRRNSYIRACGQELADILGLVCDGKYATPSPTYKRKLPQPFNGNKGSNWWQSLFFRPQLVDGDVTSSLIEKVRHHRQEPQFKGVSDECCQHACSFIQLTSYCAEYISAEEIAQRLL